MFKELGQLAGLIQQAQQMRGRMADLQESMAQRRFTGEAGNGAVRVEATGQARLVTCEIDSALLDPNHRDVLQELLVTAVNDAFDKVREASADMVKEATGGLDLGALGNLLGGFPGRSSGS
jgi:DNA-binding YbaB/EbfC family protein